LLIRGTNGSELRMDLTRSGGWQLSREVVGKSVIYYIR
jgi:hypothetical protein